MTHTYIYFHAINIAKSLLLSSLLMTNTWANAHYGVPILGKSGVCTLGTLVHAFCTTVQLFATPLQLNGP